MSEQPDSTKMKVVKMKSMKIDTEVLEVDVRHGVVVGIESFRKVSDVGWVMLSHGREGSMLRNRIKEQWYQDNGHRWPGTVTDLRNNFWMLNHYQSSTLLDGYTQRLVYVKHIESGSEGHELEEE